MELTAAIRARRMVRRFDDRSVDATLIDGLVDLAVRAPSAGNTQGWQLLVLEGQDDRDRFWGAVRDPAWEDAAGSTRWHVRQAPVVIVPFADETAYLERYAQPDKAYSSLSSRGAWPAPYWLTDTAMATQNLLLGATDVGLGAVFFAITHGLDAMRAAFDVPPRLVPIGAVALGWPAATQVRSPSLARGRRPVADVVHRGGFGPQT